MNVQDFWGILGADLLLSALVLALIRKNRVNIKHWLAVAGLFAVMLLPLGGGLSAAGYAWSFFGDLSATTVMFLLLYLSGAARPASNSRNLLLVLVCIGGLVLYPLSLGPFSLDPYEWGYRPWWMLTAIGLAGFAMARQQPATTCYLAFSLLAFALNLSASNNLWDYLFDPLLFGYAIIELIRHRAGQPFIPQLTGLTPRQDACEAEGGCNIMSEPTKFYYLPAQPSGYLYENNILNIQNIWHIAGNLIAIIYHHINSHHMIKMKTP
jgi:hypothetical protein